MEVIDFYLKSNVHKLLATDIKSKMLSHCYMLNSSDDFILNEYAFLLCKQIYCLNDKASPCNICINCDKISHGNMVDLSIWPKNEKNLMVDDINTIVTDCYIRPIDNIYKVYILKNFDLCTVQAQNKLLKTLEEPPAGVIFVLTCMNIDGVLPTILSRAKVINIPPLLTHEVEKYLESIHLENASLLAKICNGNLSTAMRLGQINGVGEIINLIFDMLKNLTSSGDILHYSNKILEWKKDITFFLNTLITVFRDICVVQNGTASFSHREDELRSLADSYSCQAIDMIVKNICSMFKKLEFNCNIVGVIDQMLLNILEVKFLCQ